jgi:hypothetical protein
MPSGEPSAGPEGSARRDLTSWWKNFKKGPQRKDEDKGEHVGHERPNPSKLSLAGTEPAESYGIFGVPLQTSVRYANVAISLSDANGQSYIYGYVPIVVAKCGVFLKEKGSLSQLPFWGILYTDHDDAATDVEGIFRLSGSEKRIKELRNTFNSPDRYGKGLDWTGYTVHDAANILRRYFNQLPEPIIPLEFYDQFRDPLRHHQSEAVGPMDGQSPSVGDFDLDIVIKKYQQLITQLPPLNRQLLLYILDLLAVFASKSDLNKMTTPNLAAIFQPGILSHPAHDMAPSEYRLSQDVLIFLIENQDHFLIGMQGTAADEKTVAEVESGPPTPQNRSSNRHSKSNIGRSGSNSSRYSGVRRSVSASSRRSRNSAGAAPSPSGSDFHAPQVSSPASAGIHRSNTLPHTRSPNLTPGRFGRDKESGQRTPDSITEVDEKKTPVVKKAPPVKKLHSQAIMQEMISPIENDLPSLPGTFPPGAPDPQAQVQVTPSQGINRTAPGHLTLPTNPLSPPSDQTTPTGRIVTALFGAKSPPVDGRRPNKLQKRRTGGSANPSAHSSTQSLTEPPEVDLSHVSIQNSLASNAPLLTPRKENIAGQMWQDDAPLKTPPAIGGNYKPNSSPAASYASHSDLEGGDPEHLNLQGDDNGAEGKRRHWFPRDRKQELSPPHTTPILGSNGLAQTSRSSILSGGEGGGRKSVTLDRSQLSGEGVTSDSERDGRKEKNPINWIKGKVRDFQDRKEERDRVKEEKRMVSPTRVSVERSGNANVPTNIDSVTSTGVAGSQKSAEQLMPPPATRNVLTRDAGRGKSLDVPRSPSQTATFGPQRQSQDIQRSPSPRSNRIVPVVSTKPAATTAAPQSGKS